MSSRKWLMSSRNPVMDTSRMESAQRRRRKIEAGAMSLVEVQEDVSGYLDKIIRLFKPGAKIAVLVRSPGSPDRDFMMTDDDLDELISMISRRKAMGCGRG